MTRERKAGMIYCTICGRVINLRPGLGRLQVANARVDGWRIMTEDGFTYPGNCPDCSRSASAPRLAV